MTKNYWLAIPPGIMLCLLTVCMQLGAHAQLPLWPPTGPTLGQTALLNQGNNATINMDMFSVFKTGQVMLTPDDQFMAIVADDPSVPESQLVVYDRHLSQYAYVQIPNAIHPDVALFDDYGANPGDVLLLPSCIQKRAVLPKHG